MNETTMELDSDRGLIITPHFQRAAAHRVRCIHEARVRQSLVGTQVTWCVDGELTQVPPPTRLAYTQIFEPMADGGEATVTVSFEDLNGKTRFVSHELYPSKEVREIVLASGMEHGMRETMDLLDELVATLA